MPFPPRKEHKITLAEAAELTRRHRDERGGGAEKATLFPRDVFEALLQNPKVKGLRLYHGRNPGGDSATIVVGVDADGNDLLDGEIFDRGFPCPPVCSGTNSLNS